MTDTATAAPPREAPADTLRHRGDIDGLRAVAILAVVAFHTGLAVFGGGFIGVDVFFVISGYLITRKLLDEVAVTERVSLLSFWANRIRRLVPALALMVVVVVIASYFVFPRASWAEVSLQARAAALYLANLLFARESQDYFGDDIERSPFLHTWSLGVEEQFYLLWPLLVGGVAIALVARARRRSGAPSRAPWVAAFSVILVSSFAVNLMLSSESSPWAFFGPVSRAWEFAAAALVAMAVPPRALQSAAARTALAVGGLAVIAVACLLLEESPAYPGLWGTVPVVATIAVLIAGDPRAGEQTWPSRLLATAPVQWLGRVSYSWYLWHWPLIILSIVAVGTNRAWIRMAAALVALPIAALSHRFVENPLRYSARLRASRRQTYLMGGAITVVTLLAATGLGLAEHVGSSTLDDRLIEARRDRRNYACEEQRSPSGIAYCLSGDVASDTTVMLIGDSHARHWKQAMAAAASTVGVKLVDTYRGACPIVHIDLKEGQDTANCEQHRDDVLQLVEEVQPDVVVLSNSGGYLSLIRTPSGGRPSEAEAARLWGAGFRQVLEQLQATGAVVAVLQPGPRIPEDPVDCIGREQDIDACVPSRAEAFENVEPLRAEQADVIRDLGVKSVLDVADLMCDERRCELEVGGNLVFADRGHFTVDFTMAQHDRLVAFLQDALARAR